MKAKSITGTIEYLTDGRGLEGVENFRISHDSDGYRVLRATSEMFNDGLVRDTVLSVDNQWQPFIAQIHLTVDDRYVGSGHYVFSADSVRFHSHSRDAGSDLQTKQLKKHVPEFGGHAVQNDAWSYAVFDKQRGEEDEFDIEGAVATSILPNGGDGPALIFRNHRHRYIGKETISTRAGEFNTRHYEFLLTDRPSIHYWVTGEDYILVKCRWDLLQQTYELVSLEST